MGVNIQLLQCCGANTKGEPCNFIQRSSKSPSMSPTLSSQLTFIAPLVLAMPVPTAQGAGKCLVNGCGQTRIADDCAHRVCCKHCIEMGGCTSKKHRPSTFPVHPPAPPAPLMPPMTPLGFPHRPSPPRASTPLLPHHPRNPPAHYPKLLMQDLIPVSHHIST